MEMLTPAQVVVREFGSLRAVAAVVSKEHTSVRLWMRERRGGSGLVPSEHHRALLTAARERGLNLTEHDLIWGRSC